MHVHVTVQNRIIQFRLASSEESRLVESYHTVTAKLNGKCLDKFRRDIEEQEKNIEKLHKNRYSPELFYTQVFMPKVRKWEGQGEGLVSK